MQMLIRACRMGLQAYTADLLEQLSQSLGGGSVIQFNCQAQPCSFCFCGNRVNHWRRTISAKFPDLIRAAYYRASFLVPGGCRAARKRKSPRHCRLCSQSGSSLVAGGETIIGSGSFLPPGAGCLGPARNPAHHRGRLVRTRSRSANRVSEEELSSAAAGHLGGAIRIGGCGSDFCKASSPPTVARRSEAEQTVPRSARPDADGLRQRRFLARVAGTQARLCQALSHHGRPTRLVPWSRRCMAKPSLAKSPTLI